MGARGKKLQCFGVFFFLSLVDSFCYFLCSSGKIHLVNLHSITWINWMKTANENERGRHCHCHRRRTKRRCFFPLSINVYFVYPFPVYHESTTNNNILYPILYAWCALLCFTFGVYNFCQCVCEFCLSYSLSIKFSRWAKWFSSASEHQCFMYAHTTTLTFFPIHRANILFGLLVA